MSQSSAQDNLATISKGIGNVVKNVIGHKGVYLKGGLAVGFAALIMEMVDHATSNQWGSGFFDKLSSYVSLACVSGFATLVLFPPARKLFCGCAPSTTFNNVAPEQQPSQTGGIQL